MDIKILHAIKTALVALRVRPLENGLILIANKDVVIARLVLSEIASSKEAIMLRHARFSDISRVHLVVHELLLAAQLIRHGTGHVEHEHDVQGSGGRRHGVRHGGKSGEPHEEVGAAFIDCDRTGIAARKRDVSILHGLVRPDAANVFGGVFDAHLAAPIGKRRIVGNGIFLNRVRIGLRRHRERTNPRHHERKRPDDGDRPLHQALPNDSRSAVGWPFTPLELRFRHKNTYP